MMKKAVSILLTLTMILAIFTVVPVSVSADAQETTYVDANGETQTVSTTVLTGSETELSPGWYAVTEDLRFEDYITLIETGGDKDINLILCDNTTMILADAMYGFYSDYSVNLNIYGQSGGSGEMRSQGGDFIFLSSPNTSLNIYGASVTSSNVNADFCTITCAGDININGGTLRNCELVSYSDLTVSSGIVNIPYMMVDQTVRFEGGSVNISGDGIYAHEIVFDLRDNDSSVKSKSYDGAVCTEWYLTDGSNIYNIGEISNPSALKNKTLRMAGHVHTYPAPTWSWDGWESATATFVCSECGESVVETADVTSEVTIEPTDNATGITAYTASVTVLGTEYTDVRTKTTHLGDHTFGTPDWEWDGYTAATVTVVCTVDEEVYSADAVITSEVTVEPSLSSEGTRVYTATATVEGQEFTDTKEETLPLISRSVSVQYRNLSNKDVTVTANKLYGDELEGTLTTGWYVVTEDLTIAFRPNCNGAVNLILADGVTFNATKGINVGDGASLTIWGQQNGTGKIIVGNIENGACIGTSASMNTGGGVTITINGGYLELDNNTEAPAIGCFRNHPGVITVNKGTIRRCSYESPLTVPLIGFIGKYNQGDGETYTININGGDIQVGDVEEDDDEDIAVAIGFIMGKRGTINISGGTITANVKTGATGIGAGCEVSACTVNITGGDISISTESVGVFDSKPTGIGVKSDFTRTCDINLSWSATTMAGCRIYSGNYYGNIQLLKAFKRNSSDTIYNAGSYSESDLENKTLVPYCSHSYGDPVWTWNTESEPFTASASFLCSECRDYQTVNATVTKSRYLAEYTYTALATFNGQEYTDTCEVKTNASMKLTVGGVQVTRDNASDILGDGKVSYDSATNTLTLNNAEIPLVQGSDYAYGINYWDTADDPFTIVLLGENTIADSQGLSGYFVWLDNGTPSYTITGGGSLGFDIQSNNAVMYFGIKTDKPLTVDNASIEWVYNNTSITTFGIALNSGASLTLKNKAVVTLDFGYKGSGNSSSRALSVNNSEIDIDETSALAMNTNGQSISGSYTLTESTIINGASVASNYIPGYVNYYTWDGTTALTSYNAIRFPDDISTHTITVVDAPYGNEDVYPTERKVGDTVEITATPQSGYGFAYMKVTKASDGSETKVYAKEFTMPACDVTVTPVFDPIVEYSEPYMTDDLDYIPGTYRHYVENGTNYGILDNGCMGAELSTPYWSYFTFEDINSSSCRITKYTGSTDGLSELVFPKTYLGRNVTQIGSGRVYDAILSYTRNLNIVLNENITAINNYAFYFTMVMRVTGDTSSLTRVGEYAFDRCLANRRLNINLYYPGRVEFGKRSLLGGIVFVHLKHSTTLGLDDVRADSITYDFIDDHLYGDDPVPVWNWSEDNSTATATFTCTDDRCQHEEVIDADMSCAVTGESHAATATVQLNGKTYTDTKTLSGHVYGEPVWSWNNDHSSATATFACTRVGCTHSETVNADVTTDFTGDAGHVYTATAQFSGNAYTDTFTVPHTCAEPEWSWNEAKTAATATFTCSDSECSFSKTVDASLSNEIESELCTITAMVEFNGETYTDTAEIALNQTLIERSEPYIDDDGAYIVGCLKHYAIGSKYYIVNEDGSVGEELNSVTLSYFTFENINGESCRITKYTGSTDGLAELVIPKTYDGRKVTQLGNRNHTNNGKIFDQSPGSLTLILNENISSINDYAFAQTNVSKVTGNTSSLNYIGWNTFWRLGNLDLKLDYAGVVTIDGLAFSTRSVVTVHMKHAAALSSGGQAASIKYDFTDDHIYGDDPAPVWTWANDYSSAAATFTCTDSRCAHKEIPDTTVTRETQGDNYVYTTMCTFGGKTYTDTRTVEIADGTEEYPFLIHNKADWVHFAENINAGVNTTAYYKLADDFDNSEAINVTVGTREHHFAGHFDGNGKEVVFNISGAKKEAMAPFSFVEDADIHDLTVRGSVTGGIHSSGLVSHDYGETTIRNVTVNVNVTNPNTTGDRHIGGVIGHNETATLTMENVVYGGTINSSGSYAGGLIGWGGNSTINMTNCLFKGSYTGSGNFHPIGCMHQNDTFSGTVVRVYYTVDANYSNSNNILTNDGIKVYTGLPENHLASTVRAADGEDYYIPASVTGIESEYDYIITEIAPEITVTAYDGTVLERGTDYTVSYDPATVRTAGDYTVTVTGIGDYTGSYSADFTVKDHTYGEPEWEWSDDLTTATLVFTDEDDGYTSRINAPVSSKISKGVHVYTAFILLYGTPYYDTEVGDHLFGEPVWTWSDDCKTAAATFTCTDARCGHTETVDATVTDTYTASTTTYSASVIFDGVEYTDLKTVDKQKYFVGHSISLAGDIRINYYLNLTDEQAQDATVNFSWTVNDKENTHSATFTPGNKTDNGYLASVPVAVAEMTYDVTATLTIGGEAIATDTYSVRRYADVILSDEYASTYTGTGNHSYENLRAIVLAMLDYGAKAQIEFSRNTDYLANKDINYKMQNVTADMITTTPSDMRAGLENYGLEYVGTTIVYLTKTSIRHYYKIVDQDKFDTVKDEITFAGEKVGYTVRNDRIFFEHTDVAASDLDTMYTLKIGESQYQYSVLDYVRDCLNAPNAPDATIQLVMATYWYNQAANAYFGG